MSRRCKHKWRMVGNKYNPPRPYGDVDLRGFGVEEAIQEILHGFTVITQQCSECGWIEAQRVTGQIAAPSNEERPTP